MVGSVLVAGRLVGRASFHDSTSDRAGSRGLRVSVGVAGWNISLLVRTVPAVWWGRLGTLLGPEETPVSVGVFLGPFLVWPA